MGLSICSLFGTAEGATAAGEFLSEKLLAIMSEERKGFGDGGGGDLGAGSGSSRVLSVIPSPLADAMVVAATDSVGDGGGLMLRCGESGTLRIFGEPCGLVVLFGGTCKNDELLFAYSFVGVISLKTIAGGGGVFSNNRGERGERGVGAARDITDCSIRLAREEACTLLVRRIDTDRFSSGKYMTTSSGSS